MESKTVLFLVGAFMSYVFVVCAYQCAVEGAECMNNMSNMGSLSQMCQALEDTVTCLNKVLAKCTLQYGMEGLISGRNTIEQQYNTHCEKKKVSYKTDVTNISTTLDQSLESTDLPIFMVITIVLGVVATGFTISTIVACHKYYSSTRSIKLKVSNYDQLDVRRMDQVTYQRAQGVGLPGAQPSGKQSIPRDYLDVVHHLYETAKESATEASPYAEIGEMNPGESPKSSP